MIYKKFSVLCIFIIIMTIFNVNAHWVDDTGPEIVEGNWADVTTRNGSFYVNPQIGNFNIKEWKEWDLNKEVKDDQGNSLISAQVYHKKYLKYKDSKKAEGDAYCMTWCVKRINGNYAKGKYDVHAQARGWLWYRGDREEDNFFGGGSWSVDKSAERKKTLGSPTYSGVHLKGKAHVSIYRGDELKLQMNWF